MYICAIPSLICRVTMLNLLLKIILMTIQNIKYIFLKLDSIINSLGSDFLKGKLTLFLILILSLGMFIFSYASESYSSDWSIEIKNQKEIFNPDDLIEVTVKNSHLIKNISDSVVHLTYNTGLLEYVSESDFENVKTTFGTELTETPYVFSDDAVGVANINNAGVFTAAFVSQNGVTFNENEVIFKVYFKVLSDGIKGVRPLNFRWIKTGVYASYACNIEGNNLNIDYKDLYVNVKGEDILEAELPTELPSSEDWTFVPDVLPSKENPENVNLNGRKLSLTTPYFVTFSKLAITNSALKEAGVIISKTNEELTLESANITKINAVNIGSDNCFGFLVYGSGIKKGTAYYTRVYATYEDGRTLYGSLVPVEIKGD